MKRRKLTKEDIDKVRDIEGFPIGTDEDIIALSDAPYYTACPNPFIEEFIRENGTPYDEATDDYHREPFSADVSEGKNDPVYNVHTYHTKVPYKAIMNYILHYTDPGDVIFDGFCGSGMVGFAAQMCASEGNNEMLNLFSDNKNNWGKRYAVLSDLSPAATFISANYVSKLDSDRFYREADELLAICKKRCAWMYKTRHTINGIPQSDFNGEPAIGDINFTVWSDVFICPTCSNEFVYWDVAIDENEHVSNVFECPHCKSSLSKRDCKHSMDVYFDEALGQSQSIAKQVPVRINYSYSGKTYVKRPDEEDLALIERVKKEQITEWYPTNDLPDGDKMGDPKKLGITHIHQYFTKRNLITLSVAYEYAKDKRVLFIVTAIMRAMSKMFRWAPHGKHTAGMPGTIFFPSVTHEYPIFGAIQRRVKLCKDWSNLAQGFEDNVIVSCGDLAHTTIPSNSIEIPTQLLIQSGDRLCA